METVVKIRDLPPEDAAALARALRLTDGLSADAEVVVRDGEMLPNDLGPVGDDGVPLWCNVLDGFSDDDLAEFEALIARGVHLSSHDE